jgi:hypothetical protein
MTPEQHRALLRRAARTGEWEAAERATRALAWRHALAGLAGLLRRLAPGRWLPGLFRRS